MRRAGTKRVVAVAGVCDPGPASQRPATTFAFTLLEIIIVLSIAAVLIALSAPFVSGMLRERQMRSPVFELQDMAKLLRARAMTENTAYEIAFTREGFLGRKHRVYREEEEEAPELTASEEQEPKQPVEEQPSEETAPEEQPEEPAETIAEFRFPEGMNCLLRFWGSREWIEPGSDFGTTSWIFQSSGLCNPIRVRCQRGESWIEVGFNPLTADIQEERYFFVD